MKTLIIAEIGVNHNGSLNIAKELIRKAKLAGADIVKFQTYITDDLVIEDTKLAKYQKKNNRVKNQNDLLKKYELSFNDFILIKNFCKKQKIEFLSSAFDNKSLDFLLKLKPKRIKVPSGEITNFFLLDKIAKTKKSVIISTGMSNYKEISEAISILKKNKITIMHCNSSYPTIPTDVNLNMIKTLKNKYKVDIGFSDHSLGYDAVIGAVALGATIIEKHFTFDKKAIGPDHSVSLNFTELKNMVKSIRNIEQMMGSTKKIINSNELDNIKIVRKSIVAKYQIKKGEKFTLNNLTAKRPGTGISPMKIKNILGKKSKKNYLKNEIIKL